MKTFFKIEGLHCPSCKALIEDVAMDVKGVTACEVDLAAGTAIVEHADEFNPSEFETAIAGLGEGYKASKV